MKKQLYNVMEEAVRIRVDEHLKNAKNVCDCESCRIDIMAIILNQLPPNYVNTDRGALYKKLNEFDPQYEVNFIVWMELAIKAVTENPRHAGAKKYFKNVMELVVDRHLDNRLKKGDVCACDDCRMDIKALTLNTVALCYAHADAEELDARTAQQASLHRDKILESMEAAVAKVKTYPQH